MDTEKPRRKGVEKKRKAPAMDEHKTLASLSVDEFLQGNFSHSDTDSDGSPSKESKKKGINGNISPAQKKKMKVAKPSQRTSLEASKHKAALGKLRDIDPEFYDFLKENDKKLLDFDVSDDDDDEDDDTKKEEDQVHKPPDSLEVASDESDYEADEAAVSGRPRNVVTIAMVNHWQENLAKDKTVGTVAEVTQAFQAALHQVEGGSGEDDSGSKYKVEGSSVFNSVVRLCLLDLIPALRHLLQIPTEATSFLPHKRKKWPKLKPHVRPYALGVVRLIHAVATPAVRRVLLRHALHMLPFYNAQPRAGKLLLKEVLRLWGTSEEESVRVLAFLCVVRLVRARPEALHVPTLKRMYVVYVRNARFTSPSAWPLIGFMRRSLVEIMALDYLQAYQYAFIYIRQLAIHLRNALTLQKKEAIQTVYNWQFIHCLHLWANLLGNHHQSPVLQPLIYPLTQVILGTIKLIPTPKYYPLMLHCVRILSQLSKDTNIFIPVLPFILEVFQNYNFTKKHTKVSMKPLDFSCILKVSKSQLAENGFKDALLDELYTAIVEYLHFQSHCIGFPELVLPALIQLKEFLRVCKIANYAQKIKQLVDKIKENCQEIEKRRKTVNFAISNSKAVEAWEIQSKMKGTPLLTFYTSWKQVREQQVVRAGIGQEMDDYNIPVIKKKTDKKEKDEKFDGLFPSDESGDEEISFMPEEKTESKRKGESEEVEVKSKKLKKQEKKDADLSEDDNDDMFEDILEDFNVADLDGDSADSDN